MENKLKVLVAMSGGVDSSVAALLMKNAGYDVVGVFMKNWSDTKNDIGVCDWRDEKRHALRVAMKLGIPFSVIDHEKEYRGVVVEDMYKKYKKGITPNPDVLCNQKIKFPYLWEEAKKQKCDYLVTGHYARIKHIGKKFKMLRAKCEAKDQSYFLVKLTQKDLSHTLFPIGDLSKEQVRDIAKKNGFLNFDKKGTVGICFIGKVNLKEFLSKKIKPKKGVIYDPNGEEIGHHDGIYYYTIGQRLGPRYGFDLKRKNPVTGRMDRWYVAKKDAKKNIIVAAPEGHKILLRKEMRVMEMHFISEDKKEMILKLKKRGKKVLVRIRQVGELMDGTLRYDKRGFSVTLKKSITGVSDGQAIVLYKGEEVLGGGSIAS
ncbi:tRNA 2-thiouridine(34) synthase MnmA [Candidatus Pacearchaeota archaeon]|nr:tRNA 2-thiouridine(34) synthase MnmA [Candidatus Pacearchaeota archaeon]